jgi:uncharacterized protein involved in type VI secretion and phage assembly
VTVFAVPPALAGHWSGVYVAVVSDVKDPDGLGRVRVMLPWAPDSSGGDGFEAWARLATLMGGSNRGSWFVPDVGDEVLVAAEACDPNRLYVLGGLWNGQATPPEAMDAGGANNKKVLRSRNGVKVTLDDTDGQETLVLETPGGQQLTLKDGPGSVELVDSNGNSLKMEPGGITVTTSAKLTVQASTVEVTAGQVTVNAAMSRFAGVVNADTVITNSVISSSYTPGAGNIW